VRADEKLAAFVELELGICAGGEFSRQSDEIFRKLSVAKPILNQAEDIPAGFFACSRPAIPENQLSGGKGKEEP
jgi:hypothetical protein